MVIANPSTKAYILGFLPTCWGKWGYGYGRQYIKSRNIFRTLSWLLPECPLSNMRLYGFNEVASCKM